jgi:hypothetical protein
MSDIFEQLASPFDPSEVDWRVGSTTKDKAKGMALAYIDARTVMDRLDTVCGPAGWQNRYVLNGTKTVCEIGIKCGDEWVWKADGAGDSDIEAEKGALSDAFKRAAVRWGIGRYLYNLKSPWVALKAFGNSYAIADEAKAELDGILRKQMKSPTPKPDAPAGKPDPYEDNLRKAMAWVRKAREELSHTIDEREVDNWYAVNTATIAKLQKGYGDQFKEVMEAIVQQRAAVQVKDAAE